MTSISLRKDLTEQPIYKSPQTGEIPTASAARPLCALLSRIQTVEKLAAAMKREKDS
jgi:hypothetical protein